MSFNGQSLPDGRSTILLSALYYFLSRSTLYEKKQDCSAMSSPFLFCLRQFPCNILTRRGFGPHVLLCLFSTSQGIKGARQSTSSSIDCGPQIEGLLLCHHHLSCVGSGTINFRQTRSPAALCNLLASPCSKRRPYHTDPKATKAINIRIWETWSSYPSLRRKQINQHLGLRYISRIFDGIFFRGLLRNRVVLKWAKTPTERLDCLSRTTLILDVIQGPRALIEVMKPVINGPWALAAIQSRLEAILYEMTLVYSLMHSRDCVSFQRSNNRAASGRKSSLGSIARQLIREAEQEANRILKGFPRRWDLQGYGKRRKDLGKFDGNLST